MPRNPTFIKTLLNKAPAGEGALSFASIPAVYIGTNPDFTGEPGKNKKESKLKPEHIQRTCFGQ